jgi:hypothetical protein
MSTDPQTLVNFLEKSRLVLLLVVKLFFNILLLLKALQPKMLGQVILTILISIVVSVPLLVPPLQLTVLRPQISQDIRLVLPLALLNPVMAPCLIAPLGPILPFHMMPIA